MVNSKIMFENFEICFPEVAYYHATRTVAIVDQEIKSRYYLHFYCFYFVGGLREMIIVT